MEIQTTSGNVEVLWELESEIVSLEKSTVEITSLENERNRLNTAVQTLTEEETQILGDDGSGNETALVKRLGELRTRRDVQSARLTNIQDRIKNAEADLTTQGANVRRAFAGVLAQLFEARRQRTTTALTELFGGPIRMQSGRIELKDLTSHTSLMRQLRDVDNRLRHSHGDPVQETLTLQQQPRKWLAEIRALVEGEQGLTLTQPPQPIAVQPANELVAA